MRKLFRRREFLAQGTRSAVQAASTAWIVRSWLDRDWGGVGTWLWWLNLSLSSLVVVSMFTLLFTKAKAGEPKREPFSEELTAFLRENDQKLITREMLASLRVGADVWATPYLKPDTAVFVNPDVIDKLISDWDERFKGTGNAHRTMNVTDELKNCGRKWGTTGTPGHCCVIPAKFHGLRCVCDCGVTTLREEAEPKGEGS